MILNIHGFGSCGLSGKSMLIRNEFEDVISPSLSYIPELTFDTLEQIIEYGLSKNETIHLIGSSIGGYISIYLSNKYNLKAVLINPAICPYKFDSFVGYATNYYDKSQFQCTKEHLRSLKKYEVLHVKDQSKFMLLVQKGDELLDYKDALDKLPNAHIFLEEGGSHGFERFDSKIMDIRKFFSN
ncbi:MAG: esterase [Campylobacteraceae bacterium]|nr:esterase [Campylobacteraceae bacterium]